MRFPQDDGTSSQGWAKEYVHDSLGQPAGSQARFQLRRRPHRRAYPPNPRLQGHQPHSPVSTRAAVRQKGSQASFELGNHILDARDRFNLVGMGWLEILNQRSLAKSAENREIVHLVSRQYGARMIAVVDTDR